MISEFKTVRKHDVERQGHAGSFPVCAIAYRNLALRTYKRDCGMAHEMKGATVRGHARQTSNTYKSMFR